MGQGDEKHGKSHGPSQLENNSIAAAKLRNPLHGLSREQLMNDVDRFAKEKGLEDHIEGFRRGALLAQHPDRFEQMDELSENDKEQLRIEKLHRWRHPFMLYCTIFLWCVRVPPFMLLGYAQENIKSRALLQLSGRSCARLGPDGK